MEVRWSATVTRTSKDGLPVYVKQYHEGDWGRSWDVVCARAARETSVLERLHGAQVFRGRLGTLTLANHNVTEGILTTFEVPGRPLDDYLLSAYRRPGKLCHKALFLAGRWLRQFQRMAPLADDYAQISQFDSSDLLEYCDRRAAHLQELGYVWPTRAQRLQLRTVLQKLLSIAEPLDRQHVLSHGDYGPSNVLWDERTLTPIDFSMIHVDVPLADVTYFIHRCQLLAVFFPWRRWPLLAWQRAFLRGYGRAGAETSPIYRAMMIRHWLCRLTSFVRKQPANMKQALHNAWIRRCARQNLTRLIAAV